MSVSQESFKKKLKEKGLKVTNQRLLVLQVLAENKDRHLTAEDIYCRCQRIAFLKAVFLFGVIKNRLFGVYLQRKFLAAAKTWFLPFNIRIRRIVFHFLLHNKCRVSNELLHCAIKLPFCQLLSVILRKIRDFLTIYDFVQ